MKKMIALFLSLLMLMSMTGAMASEVISTIELTEKVDIQMELPEGYTAMKQRLDSVLYAGIYTNDENKPQFTLSIAYSDLTYAVPEIVLTSEEEIEQAKQIIGMDFADPTYTVEATTHGTKFLVINENGAEEDYAHLVTNYQGYFIQMYINAAEGAEVTDEDIATALAILSSLALVTE